MCGRFSLKSTIQAIEDEFNIESNKIELKPRYNIAPTQDVAVVVYDEKRILKFFKWGLIPAWSKDQTIGSRLINARAETLTQKVTFKNLLKRSRCIIVADGFYEWEKGTTGKNPYYFSLKTQRPFGFAGLWTKWTNQDGVIIFSCTIITVEPNSIVGKIHNRMPAILKKSNYKIWLDTSFSDETDLLKILEPYSDSDMISYRVSKIVNSPNNDNPTCIEPIN